MLGYVIGLGDRHLDNILLDHETGEVVHIDYNICFEKGTSLRVPERVPFRLTQNMEGALGLAGLNGAFMNAAEKTLTTLRNGKETLLTLLEAFVYDPLVDWTGAVDAGYAGAIYGGAAATDQPNKKQMEQEIHRSLLATRLLEARQPMFSMRDETCRALASLIDKLEEYNNVNRKLIFEQESMKKVQSVQRLLENSPDTLITLPERYRRHKAAMNKQAQLKEHLNQRKTVLSTQRKMVEQISSNCAREIELLMVDLKSQVEFASPVQAAEVFLKEIGQKQLADNCIELHSTLIQTITKRQEILYRGGGSLQLYSRIQQLYPGSSVKNHRIIFWSEAIDSLVSEPSGINAQRIKTAHDQLVQSEDTSLNGARKRLIKAKSGCLAAQIEEPRDGLKTKLQELFEKFKLQISKTRIGTQLILTNIYSKV